jgi:hypothetical protein
VKASGKRVVAGLGVAAAAAVAGVLVPWLLAAWRGDLWIDTLGYEVQLNQGGPRPGKHLVLDFMGSSEGGSGRIEVISISDGRRVRFPSGSIITFPPHMAAERVVEHRPANGEGACRPSPFQRPANAEPERRGRVPGRAELRLDGAGAKRG